MAQSRNLISGRGKTVMLTLLALMAALAAGCGGNGQGTQTRTVIVGPPEEQGDANSSQPAISADGRFVAFTSESTNLGRSATLGRNVFIKDVESGATTLVSASEAGTEGNGDSEQPAISADGRFVAFASDASDLVAADGNDTCLNAVGANINCRDVFLKDTQTGGVKLVSADGAGNQAEGTSRQPAISADGRFIAFVSDAPNLAPGDGNGETDVFLKDMSSGALQQVSANPEGSAGNGRSALPAISADGRYVAFSSLAEDLVENDANGKTDVFIRDTQTGALALVSTDAAGAQGNRASGFDALAISADGRFVVFESEADNLVEGDANGKRDVFLKDTQTGAVTLVSTDAAGAQGEDDSFMSVAVSRDGRTVFFSSNANNLAPGDVASKSDIFRKDVSAGTVDILSTDSAGAFGDGSSECLAATPDGALVAFSSSAANLAPGDANGKDDIFLKDLRTGETVIVSTSSRPEETG
ncbi:MAG: hypothetical protein C4534_03225 [Gaiellales bacterium]|nr:MAG: hypothetical protein C4534_03225 [Gaiellales bacterium]